jgi:hypothetical protein
VRLSLVSQLMNTKYDNLVNNILVVDNFSTHRPLQILIWVFNPTFFQTGLKLSIHRLLPLMRSILGSVIVTILVQAMSGQVHWVSIIRTIS